MLPPIGKYGWIPQKKDYRDFKYQISQPIDLPPFIDHTDEFQPVYNQSSLGSCTSQGIAGIVEYTLKKEGKIEYTPSRLFIYYNEREAEGSVESDSGAIIRDGLKSINQKGVCHEETWPYDIDKFAVKPSDEAYTEAKQQIISNYASIPDGNIWMLKQAIAKNTPFVFGFTVYDGFESSEMARTGVLHLPLSSEGVLGGHCVVGVGYDDRTERFIIRNSWGPNWGMKGYFTMPYDYMKSLTSDFWVINTI